VIHNGMPYDLLQGQGQGHRTLNLEILSASVYLVYNLQ